LSPTDADLVIKLVVELIDVRREWCELTRAAVRQSH